jgi:peroxiredoxin
LVQALRAKITYIGGHFQKPKAKTVTIKYYASVINNIEHRSTIQELNIDDKNNFLFEIETEIPISFHLINGSDWLFINKYVAPGDSLNFDFRKDQIEVTGNCEDCIDFLFNWEEKFLSGKKVNEEFNSSYTRLDPKEFAGYWDKRRKDQLNYFHEFFQGKTVPVLFKQYMEAEINYSYAVAILQYSWQNKSAKKILLDKSYLAFLDNIVVDNPDALISGRYIHFLRELPQNIWSTYGDFDNLSDPVNQYYGKNQTMLRDSIARKHFSGIAYDLALYQILFESIRNIERMKGESYYDIIYKNSDSILSLFHASFNNQYYYDRLVNKLRDLNKPNREAPDFSLFDLNGNKVKLSDFKGKVVYLDFWATNCAPCVKEVTDAIKLKEKFKDENVVFLYVSLDHSIDKLRRFIDAKSFNGIHLIDQRGFASEVADSYEINAIPRYFLIDQNGFIVNENAPRPSANPEKLIQHLIK